jgi:diadenosine tetraphosphate (Ap4A) HIT family hydrolase
MARFQLAVELFDDTIPLGRLSLCTVLLMDDARYPWLILVPERAEMNEIIDLEPVDRARLMDEIGFASEALRSVYAPDKLNVGALGNRVRQLHVHVMARFVSDEAWPGPVWGHGTPIPYPPHMAAVTAEKLIASLRPCGLMDFPA